MSETAQNIKCGWVGCAHKFGSEVDMNMHVMMNHMCLLEHGNFVLNRGAVRRKRPLEVDREPSPEIAEIPAPRPDASLLMARVKTERRPFEMAPAPMSPLTPPPRAPQQLPIQNPESSTAPPSQKTPRIIMPEPMNPNPQLMDLERILGNMIPPVNPPIDQGQVHQRFQQLQHFQPPPPPPPMSVMNDGDSDGSIQNGDEQAQFDAQDQLNMMMANPPKLSDIVDEFLERLRPMKQLGFIRPARPVYCLVCLKYVRSFHECNWKHTPGEERIAEMWYRRFQKERPNGKNQLMKELLEIKEIILHEETEDEAKD